MIDIRQTYEQPLLSKLALKYSNRELIASKIFPWVPVPTDQIKYPKWDRGAFFKRANTAYGARSRANELELKVTKASHELKHRGLGAWIDDDERRLSAGICDPRAAKMELLQDAMLLDLELEVSSKLLTAGSYASTNKATLSGSDQFSHASSDPKATILAAQDAMIKRPNKMVVGRQVHSKITTNPKVLEAVKYTDGAIKALEYKKLADYFEVDEYIVAEGLYDTAAEGQTESLSYIWGKFCWLGYVAPDPNPVSMMGQPSFGYMPISREKGNLWRVYTKSPDPTMGVGDGMEYVKVDATYELLVCAYDLGYLFTAAVA